MTEKSKLAPYRARYAAALTTGVCVIAVLITTGRLETMRAVDMLSLLAAGICIGAGIVLRVTQTRDGNSQSPHPNPASR